MNRALVTPLAAVAVAAAVGGGFLTVAQAEDCYGLNSARVCVTPEPSNFPSVDPTASSIEECVHVGSSCTPVKAPVPGVNRGSGPIADLECYTPVKTCTQVLLTLLPPPD